MASEAETKQSRYAEKRKATRIVLELYLDDTEEKLIHDRLKDEPRGGVKKTIIEALRKHYSL